MTEHEQKLMNEFARLCAEDRVICNKLADEIERLLSAYSIRERVKRAGRAA